MKVSRWLSASTSRFFTPGGSAPLSRQNATAPIVTQGLEASYTGRQYLSDGSLTPGYSIFAVLLRCHRGAWTLVLNGENLLDCHQKAPQARSATPLRQPGLPRAVGPG